MEKIVQILKSVYTYILLLLVCGVASISTGIYLMFGPGPAAVSTGIMLLALTAFLVRNISDEQ